MSIISPCVSLLLTEGDLGVPRLCCLQLLPMLVPFCPEHFSWPWQSIPGSAQVSLPLGPLSCTTIPFNSPPPPSKKHRVPHVYNYDKVLFFFKMSKETCVTYWKKKRETCELLEERIFTLSTFIFQCLVCFWHTMEAHKMYI